MWRNLLINVYVIWHYQFWAAIFRSWFWMECSKTWINNGGWFIDIFWCFSEVLLFVDDFLKISKLCFTFLIKERKNIISTIIRSINGKMKCDTFVSYSIIIVTIENRIHHFQKSISSTLHLTLEDQFISQLVRFTAYDLSTLMTRLKRTKILFFSTQKILFHTSRSIQQSALYISRFFGLQFSRANAE